MKGRASESAVTVNRRVRPQVSGWRMFLLLMAIGTFVFAAPRASASDETPAKVDVFATKGVIYNPGGGSSATNKSTSFFVGARQANDGLDIGVWTADGVMRTYIVDSAHGANAQQRTRNTGSAVIFNNLLYIFLAEYSGTASSGTKTYDIVYYTVNPDTYQVQGGRQVVTSGVSSEIPGSAITPINVAATIWNSAIYLFGPPSSSNRQVPLIAKSQDGQSWSVVLQAPPGNVYPSVIHDAITISSSQVPGLQTAVPNISDTIVLLIGSNWNSDGSLGTAPAVFYYDPGLNQYPPQTGPIFLPMPTLSQHNGTVINAAAFFGTLDGAISQTGGPCNPYKWGQQSVPAALHVIAPLNSSSVTSLSHWYLDPVAGNWMLEEPCQGVDQIWWPLHGCSDTDTLCSVAVAPYYYTSAQGSCPNDLCSTAQVFSPGWSFNFSGNQWHSYYWGLVSDYWHIDPNFYKDLNPLDYQTLNDDVSAAMRQMWQLIGVIAGPPPFDGKAFNAENLNVSSVDFGYAHSSSNTQQGTWSTDYTFGDTIKMGPPCARTKLSMQASHGASVTQGKTVTTTVTMDAEMGTDTQTSSQFGQMGWVYLSGPVISPQLYQALWAKDNHTVLGYSQTAMVIAGNEKLFYPFYLQNPGQVDSSDPGTGVFGLMKGSMAFPASSDVAAWNLQPQWDYSPETVDPSSYKVVVGQKNQLASPLQGGYNQTQSFTKATTSFTTKDTESQKTESISEKLELPIVPEAASRSSDQALSNTTEVDMSQGYETESTSSTEVDKSLTLSYFVNEATTIGVYPYFLQASTHNAPWVPTGYTGPLPWLLTWYAAGIPAGGSSAFPAESPSDSAGYVFARTPTPDRAGGSITGYGAPNARESAANGVRAGSDSYYIKGGKLATWRMGDSAIPIAMTAQDFDPDKTVSITINNAKIPISPSLGVWKLTGQIWRYKSKQSPGRESVSLALDFGAKTWDFEVSKARLWWYADPLNPVATVTLNLNNLAVLTTRIRHGAAYRWQAELSGVDAELPVEFITVDKDFNGKGRVTVRGNVPASLKEFGDIAVEINESRHDIRLTTVDGFTRKLFNNLPIFYVSPDAAAKVNLKTGKWKCEIDSARFNTPRPVGEKDAKTSLKVKVGGRDVFSQRIWCDYYTMKLKYPEPASNIP